MGGIEKFTNKTFNEIMSNEKYNTPEKVLKLYQQGDDSLEVILALMLYFNNVRQGVDATIDNMCGFQYIYVSKIQEVRNIGKDENNKNIYEYGQEWLKAGRCNSLEKRYADKRGGFVCVDDYKVWKVYPKASILIDEKITDGRLGTTSEPKWKNANYGKTELYDLNNYNPKDFIDIIEPLISEYNKEENNLPKRKN
tara:strand:- start:10 stop:597 length:588 start_codon:yes stop_codon:yes gene_type:complete